MHTPADIPLSARWATAGGAALLLGIVVILPLTVPGIAPAAASGPAAIPGTAPEPDPLPSFEAPTTAPSSAKCMECGVIESTREISGHAGPNARDTKHYETMVRFPDGSRRAIHDVNPAAWRTGERVILIAGTK